MTEKYLGLWVEDQFNAGVAAGQTVMHLHGHVISRRVGDVADPGDGAWDRMPGGASYLAAGFDGGEPGREGKTAGNLPNGQDPAKGR